MKEYFVVDGFKFFNKEEYDLAVKDYDTIKYIKERFDFTNPKSVYKLYYQLIDENTFKTVVGQAFLKKLYDALCRAQSINNNELPLIIVKSDDGEKLNEEMPSRRRSSLGSNKSYEKQIKTLNEKLSRNRIILVFLIIIIIAMFVITINNDSLNYNNAYNSVVDEYEEWNKNLNLKEKELQEKEALIKEREEALAKQENKAQGK